MLVVQLRSKNGCSSVPFRYSMCVSGSVHSIPGPSASMTSWALTIKEVEVTVRSMAKAIRIPALAALVPGPMPLSPSRSVQTPRLDVTGT